MTAITANGESIFEGSITAPSEGAWHAELQTRAELATGSEVTISDGSFSLRGTVLSGALAVDRYVARISGGAGALSQSTGVIHRQGTTVRAVLSDICSGVGESPSPLLSPAVASKTLPFWSQSNTSAGEALSALAKVGSWVWRAQRDGLIWIGDPGLSSAFPDFTVLEPHPEEEAYDVAPEGLALWVGVSQQGAPIRRVEYSIGRVLRCTYWI